MYPRTPLHLHWGSSPASSVDDPPALPQPNPSAGNPLSHNAWNELRKNRKKKQNKTKRNKKRNSGVHVPYNSYDRLSRVYGTHETPGSRYRITALLSRIKYRNRGNWCGPRVVPVLREEIFRKIPKTLTRTPPLSRKNQAFFGVGGGIWSITLKVIP